MAAELAAVLAGAGHGASQGHAAQARPAPDLTVRMEALRLQLSGGKPQQLANILRTDVATHARDLQENHIRRPQ